MDTRKMLAAAAAALACGSALLLASCGGGGGGGGGDGGGGGGTDTTPAPVTGGSDVPASATLSADGAFAFVASVAASRDDSAEPLVLGDAVLATSESDEPRTLQ